MRVYDESEIFYEIQMPDNDNVYKWSPYMCFQYALSETDMDLNKYQCRLIWDHIIEKLYVTSDETYDNKYSPKEWFKIAFEKCNIDTLPCQLDLCYKLWVDKMVELGYVEKN